MQKNGQFLLGMLVGAAIMYLLDPDRGRRRRALLRDQVVHGTNELEEAGHMLGSRARHLRNRARGVMAETRARMRHEEVDDPVLEGRVRSHLGRMVADASSIEVSAEHGRVTLRGTAPDSIIETLVEGVQNVPGVHDVINRLRSAETAG